jgi:hypothetical protein
MINKYLQHILRKNNKGDTLQNCLDNIDAKKEQDLKTYLYLIQKRLQLECVEDHDGSGP